MSQRAFFDQVADALIGFLPPDLRDFGSYRTSHNIKVWYGDDGRREHYEVQVISGRHVQASGQVLEIGFHAEHRDASDNEDAIARLTGAESRWRKALGDEPEAGTFLGHKGPWRRLSEVWSDDGVTEPEAAIEAAERLAAYIRTFEPVRRAGSS